MTTAELDNLFNTEAAAQSEGFKTLEPGAYEGHLVGITFKNFKKFQSEETEPKMVWTFQIIDDEGEKHYVRTQPMKNVAHEKSGYGKLAASWLKKDASELAGTNVCDYLGLPAQIVVDIEEKNDKKYTRVANVLAAKKKQEGTAPVADAIPAFIVHEALTYRLAAGITVKVDDAVEEVPAPATVKMDNSDDDMPF